MKLRLARAVGVQNVDLVGNTLDTPNRFGIHLEKDIRGFTVVANTVSDTVPHGPTGSPRAVCFRVKESNNVWGHAAANTWQRTTGTSDAVEITGTPSTTFGCRYDASNKAIGGFANILTTGTLAAMHVESSFPRQVWARATILNDGATWSVSSTDYGIASVNRTGIGVLEITFEKALTSTDYQGHITPRITSPGHGIVSGRNVSTVTVTTYDGNDNPADYNFMVTVLGY